MSNPTIGSFYNEERVFPPSPEFVANALVTDRSLWDEADADYEAFWARQARELIDWDDDFHTTLEWNLPDARWFVGGTLNVSVNCLDRHVDAGLGDRVAYHWEGEPGDTRTITYRDLLVDVCRLANGLRSLGVRRGDRVAIYMPMIPETVVAMLACSRIGAAHSLVFGGFSPDALTDRINDAEAVAVITADAGYRRGQPSALKPNVDEALQRCSSVRNVIVAKRCGPEVPMQTGRDLWMHELMADQPTECEPERMDSEDLLYLLYTSGTTAKPKGIMHTTGGYLTQVAWTHKFVFDLRPESDVFWCAADVGWVTGHSYIVYGALANAATSVMYEGTPDTPREELRSGTTPAGWDKDRWWDIIERYGVTQLYAAPTAVRTFMKWGEQWPGRHDLSSLRLLGSVGEPINPEAWMWYHTHIGGERCPVVDTWWQTETGGHMITPMPGVTATKPGSACGPIPGVFVEVVDDHGTPISEGGGYLTITKPWPSMLRGIWGNPERYRAAYWDTYAGRYFAGDGARIDADGYIWLLGRVDDVMNVSGHRISTTEVESALVDHEAVAEAAVVGVRDDVTGQAIVGYVIPRQGYDATKELGEDIRTFVAKHLGAIARPHTVILVPDLPKTRSGKIMRRLLRDVAEGRELGDTTTLADPHVFDSIDMSRNDED
jgi:acetyl-CoA synthetase